MKITKSSKITALVLSLLILFTGCSRSENLQQEETLGETLVITQGDSITDPENTTEAPITLTADTITADTVFDTTTEATTTTAVTTTTEATTTTAATTTTEATTTTAAETTTAATTPKPEETTEETTAETTAEPVAELPVLQPTGSSYLNDYTQKWGYQNLPENEQKAYAKMFEALAQGEHRADVEGLGITESRLKILCFAFEKDNPNFLSVKGKYSCKCIGNDVLYIEMVADSVPPQTEKFNSEVSAVINAAKALPNDYERILYVHDYIINHTKYINSGNGYAVRADGPFVYGEAICRGYTNAFMYVMQELGIPCVAVEGKTKVDHLWNMVMLEGNWYHIDLTYDDPVSPTGEDLIRYNYFLVSDSTIGKTHTIDANYINPLAEKDYGG